MFTKKISAVAAAITAAAALAVVNPSVADAAPKYPRIHADLVSYGNDDGRVFCDGSAKYGFWSCQTTESWSDKAKPDYNMFEVDLEEREVVERTFADFDANLDVFKLKEGKKYLFNGIVVQGKNGTLYFSSPKQQCRGEVQPDFWTAIETD
ncbi:hypothetical protein [uncultured Corynebacterium sp.]|uniref:hypothetical protein n=1 Tax=uncultured Corynebacterium sp. TaxID=159447 RepID=UPI0025947EF6|nr:hypothetical protein [uncultured Corynebacterium sp.]